MISILLAWSLAWAAPESPQKGDLLLSFGYHSLETILLSQEIVKGRQVWILTYRSPGLAPEVRARRVVPAKWALEFKDGAKNIVNLNQRDLASLGANCSSRFSIHEVKRRGWEGRESCLDSTSLATKTQISQLIERAQRAAGLRN